MMVGQVAELIAVPLVRGRRNFVKSWAGVEDMARGARRRLIRILRWAHRVLGLRRDSLGLGMLGCGGSVAGTSAADIGAADRSAAILCEVPICLGCRRPLARFLRFVSCPATVLIAVAGIGLGASPEAAYAATYQVINCTNVANTGPDGLATPAGVNAVDGSGLWSNVVGCNASGGGYQGAQVMGYEARATGHAAVVLGFRATGAERGTAVGMDASATGFGSTAVGQWASAGGEASIAIGGYTGTNSRGMGASASGQSTIAIGGQSTATGVADVAMGWQAKAASGTTSPQLGTPATAIGTSAEATGLATSAFGYHSIASGTGATAAGAQSRAVADYATALGVTLSGSSGAAGKWSTALGTSANATLDGATAVGARANATGQSAIAIGSNNNPASNADPSVTAAGTDSIAIGNRSTASSAATQSVAIGASSAASAASAIALGYRAAASGSGAMALGGNATGGASAGATDSLAFGGQSAVASGATSGIAVGRGASVAAAAVYGVALGDAAAARQANDIAIGRNASTNAASSGNNIAVGNGVATGAAGQNVAMGSGTTTANSRTAAGGAVAIGRDQKATGNGAVALGDPNTANGDGAIALGANNVAAGDTGGTTAANGAVAIGNANQAIGQGSVALGNASKASAAGAVAMGDTAEAQAARGVAIGSAATAVSANDVALGAGSRTAAAVGTASATIDGTTYNFQGTNPGSTVSVGTAGAERTITNVAAGRLSTSSTDAVNGSQLNATNQAVTSLGTGVDALGNSTASAIGGGASYNAATGQLSPPSFNIAGATQNNVGDAINALNQGWSLTAQGANGTAVKPGDTVDFSNGDGNVVVSKGAADNNVKVDLAQNLAVTSVTTGDTRVDTNGVTISNGPNGPVALSGSGLDNGGNRIVGVAAGSAGTDAVNVDQLTQATSGTTAAGLNFGGNSGAAVHRDLGSTLAITGGATAAGTYSGGNLRTVTDPANGVIGLEIADAPKFGNVTINDGGSGKITGMTAGTVDANSTDAVNGSQLYGASKTLGDSTASAIGAGAGYDPATGKVTPPSFNIAGATQNNVGDAINALNQGWSLTAQGANGTAVKPGDTVDFSNGDGNVVVSKGAADNNVKVDLAQNLAVTSVTTGDTRVDTNGVTISNGPNGPVALSGSGLDNGGNRIVGVAAGSAGTDAVNVDQLTQATSGTTAAGLNFGGNSGAAVHRDLGSTLAITGGATAVGTYSGGNLRTVTDPANGAIGIQIADAPSFDAVTINNGGPALSSSGIDMAGKKIANLAPGTVDASSTDAVNGSQLYGASKTLGDSTASAIGAGAGYDPATGKVTPPSFNIAGATQNNVGDAINALNQGWSLTAQGANGTAVKPGDTVDFSNGDGNVVVSKGGADNNVKVDLAQNLAVTSVTTGDTRVDTNGVTISNGPNGPVALSGSGLDNGGNRIVGVAAGSAGTDAVNVDQLTQATSGTTAAGLNFGGNSGAAVHRDLGSTLAITGGATAAGTYSGGNLKTVTDPANGAIGLEIADAPSFDAVTINNGGPALSSSGIDMAGKKIANLAPGTVDASSTDAVNGSQLYGASKTLGDSTASAIGAGAGYDPATGKVTPPSFNIAGATQNNVGDAINALNQGWNVVASGNQTGGAATAIKPGQTLTLEGGNNIALTQSGQTISIATSATPSFDSVTINGGGPVLTANGIDMGNQKIANLAPGSAGTDAVNVDQLTQATSGTTAAGLNFGGNSGGVVHRDLGSTLAITGGATAAGTYSGGNLKTVTDPANGAIGIEIADAPKFGNVTINDGGSGKITGVTAGTVDANSTDAVNGSQLHAANQMVGKLGDSTAKAIGGGANFDPATGEILPPSFVIGAGNTMQTSVGDAINALNRGWTLKTTGEATGAQVQSDSVVAFAGGKNIQVTRDGTEITIATSATPSFDSVTIDGGPVLSSSGIDMAGKKITNLAAGTAGTDAVNVDQLQGVVVGATKYFRASSTLADSQAIGADSVAIGPVAVAQRSGDVALGNGASTAAGQAGDVALGAGSVTSTVVATSGITINGTAYSFAGAAPQSTLSIGAAGAERTLTNMAAGRVAADSSDGVNGSQLFAAVQATEKVNKKLDFAGNSIASAFGGDSTYDPVTGRVTAGFKWGGTSYGSVQNVFDQIGGAVNGGGIKYFHANSALADSQAIGADSVALGPRAVASGANSIAMGNNARANGANSVALGANSVAETAVGTSSTTINGKTYQFAGSSPTGTVSVGASGSERTITNVAAGRVDRNSTDAVNGSQLWSTNQAVDDLASQVGTVGQVAKNAVVYDTDANGNRSNSVSLVGGDPNAPVVIHNVAAGTAKTDAVNVGQLNDGLANTLAQSKSYADQVATQTLGQANAYTDQKFAGLSSDIAGVRKEARQAAAIGLAAASLRYDDRPGKLSAAVGGGAWRGEGAMAFGVGYTSQDGLLRANLSGTTSGGQWGVAAGLSLTLN